MEIILLHLIPGEVSIEIIQQLSESTVNKIAAGEVVERPASVLKELVENSIDAGSSQIDIEIEDAGLKLIKITDNGSGIRNKDVEIAFKKHSTSKIQELNDLNDLSTLGFRGEALPSIASVSRIELITKTRSDSQKASDTSSGTKIEIDGGRILSVSPIGCPEGTIIKVKNLFYNVPARKKFLKTPKTELSHITDWVMRFALAYPEIRFRLTKDGADILNTPATGNLIDTVATIFGSSFASELLPIKFTSEAFEVEGFIGKPLLCRRDNTYQFIFVNGRFVTSNLISSALAEAFHTMLMKHKYPTAILNFKIEPSKLDVNIHPTKLQIRFAEEKKLYPALVEAIKSVLNQSELIPELKVDATEEIKEPVGLLTQSKIEAEKRTLEITEPSESSTSTPKNEITALNEVVSTTGIDKKDTISEDLESIIVNQTTFSMPESSEAQKGFDLELPLKMEGIPSSGGTHIPLAQLHDSYILIQTPEGMIVVDQHALHERIMYEKLKAQFQSSPMITQELIEPVSLEFNSRDYQTLINYSEILSELGFQIEPFGKNTILVRSLPTVLGRMEDRKVIFDVLDELLSAGRIASVELQREQIIQIIACKSAIKAGERLNPEQIKKLLSAIPKLNSPYTCAHGRPTILHLPLKELEKQFKRTG